MYFCCMQKTNSTQIYLLFQIYHTLYNCSVKPVNRAPVHLLLVLTIAMHFVNRSIKIINVLAPNASLVYH